MTQRALDLAGEQLAIVAEVVFQGVAVDDDPVFEAFAGDAVAEVLAVGAVLGAEVGDDHRDVRDDPLELLRQGVDRVGDQPFELPHLAVVRHGPNGRVLRLENPPRESKMRDAQSGSTKLRRLSAAFAVLAIFAGGAVWSGCGSSDDSTDGTATAKQEVEEGVKKAEEGLEEGTEEAKKGIEKAKEQIEDSKGSTKKGIEEGTEQAEKGIEEGKAQAEKGIEEAKEQAEKYLP